MKVLMTIKISLISLIFMTLSLTVYGYYSIPDEFSLLPDEKIEIESIYTLTYYPQKTSSLNMRSVKKEGNYRADVKLFDRIYVKTTNVNISKRKYVVPSGNIFGLRLFTKGVLIVSTNEVETENGVINPSQKAGIKDGDVLLSINGKEVKNCNEVAELLSICDSAPLTLVLARDGKEFTVNFSMCFSSAENKYRAGWWIRDSAAGIGTMTFYDNETGIYAGLGHGVCDVDTGDLLPLYYGDIVSATILSCNKGKSGKAGELCGTFTSGKIGTISENSDKGVFGILDSKNEAGKLIPVALNSEVSTGTAKIISTVDNNGPEEYSVEIERIDVKSKNGRNLIIKITDDTLLEKTGGIVQGMSGSPIIQNGKLVGAVTHVLINDPTKGYGIFADNMLEEAYKNVVFENAS